MREEEEEEEWPDWGQASRDSPESASGILIGLSKFIDKRATTRQQFPQSFSCTEEETTSLTVTMR